MHAVLSLTKLNPVFFFDKHDISHIETRLQFSMKELELWFHLHLS